jgi:hypothetical protein
MNDDIAKGKAYPKDKKKGKTTKSQVLNKAGIKEAKDIGNVIANNIFNPPKLLKHTFKKNKPISTGECITLEIMTGGYTLSYPVIKRVPFGKELQQFGCTREIFTSFTKVSAKIEEVTKKIQVYLKGN